MPKRTYIFSILIVVGLLVVACSRQPAVAAPPETRAERLAALDRIAVECQVSRAMFELVGEDELHLRPRPDEDYEHVDCALTKLRDSGLLHPVPMGFVGNETPAPEANNAQAH